MFVFSVTAKAKSDIDGFERVESAPFIFYIDFQDLVGAEYLARYYVTKEGFYEVTVDKRRQLERDKLAGFAKKNKQVKEALKTGYVIQLFDKD